MRLIDADALISFIDPEHLRHSGELTFSEIDVINMLNHAPTAFDVDKVVAQLEEEKDSSHNDFESYAEEHSIDEECDDWFFRGLDRAIDIVKGSVIDAGKRGKSEDAEELRSNSEATSKWVPCSERLPETDEYILLSFSNYSGLVLGRYEEDDGGGAFYEGDSLTPLTQYDAFVNAWMSLPEPYREVR